MPSVRPALVALVVAASGCAHDWDAFALDHGTRDGLLLHLPFDEGSGPITGDTVSGDPVGVIEGGATFEPGRRGDALRLDGADDRVVVTLAAPITVEQSFTVALWLRADRFDGNIFSSAGSPHFAIRLDSRFSTLVGVAAHIDQSDWPEYDVSASADRLALDTWHHVAFSSNDGELVLYVDGEPVATTTIPTPSGETASPTCHVAGSAFAWLDDDTRLMGSIDDIRVYDRPLGASEIVELATPLAE
jgi:hypothetical protein